MITNDWIAGFVDGDGCFNIEKRVTKKGVTTVRHRFIVSQDKRSKDVLYALKKVFQCGSVHKSGSNMFAFQIGDRESIKNKVIPFFKKNPLQTEKRKRFELFAESVLNCREEKSENLLPLLHSEKHPLHREERESNPLAFSISDSWFAGFVDAEGCFSVSIVGNYPRPQLLIGVSQGEKALLVALQAYLRCGRIRLRKDGFLIYQVSSTKDLQDHVFPKLFTRSGNPLLRTIKRISSQKFRKIVLLFLKKQHLTQPGLDKIVKLKANLNLASTNSVVPVCREDQKESF